MTRRFVVRGIIQIVAIKLLGLVDQQSLQRLALCFACPFSAAGIVKQHAQRKTRVLVNTSADWELQFG